MVARRLSKSWAYDFTLPGHPRQRKGGFRTKAEAEAAERRAREDLLLGRKRVLFADAYDMYLAGTIMKDRSRDICDALWPEIRPSVGHLYIEEVTTAVMDDLKRIVRQQLTARRRSKKPIAPKTVNLRLGLVKAVLRFTWKRGLLPSVPYVPMDPVPRGHKDWYTAQERDRLLDGMFELRPRWYLFFYLTARLGLRLSEVYAISTDRVRDIPPRLVVDRQVQRAYKNRPVKLITRKNDEAYVLDLPDDVMDAIKWHVEQGYAGPEFLFSKDGTFPKYLDSHKRPLREVQRELGLRELSHHALGRRSVASQANAMGHSVKAIQAQLGHRSRQSTDMYIAASSNSAGQLRLVRELAPRKPAHGNLASTGNDGG
ncbi:MAG: tyrosine-type recombinase/integrase [Myxococcota bacterium]